MVDKTDARPGEKSSRMRVQSVSSAPAGLTWESQSVRDLAWCLGSPPLIINDDEKVIWPCSDWYRSLLTEFENSLRQLDKDPAALDEALAQHNDRRLGARFENLIAQWLRRSPRYELLCRNLALRVPDTSAHGRGQKTLGEMDFIVRDHRDERVEHWEVAVKFYLGRPGVERGRQWQGPGLKDRLDKKLARITKHQLPLTRLPQATALLKEKGLEIHRSRVILKGRLFYPINECVQEPAHAAPDHLRGWWLRAGDFLEVFGHLDWHWRRLDRSEWLAPCAPYSSVAAPTCDSARIFGEALARQALKRPCLVAAFAAGEETSRGFVVPDDWGE